ncbi:MAG: hypothetical protein WAW53_09890 [Candidatus Dormiibacterota bacterium]
MTYVIERPGPVSTGPARCATVSALGGMVAEIAVAFARDFAIPSDKERIP